MNSSTTTIVCWVLKYYKTIQPFQCMILLKNILKTFGLCEDLLMLIKNLLMSHITIPKASISVDCTVPIKWICCVFQIVTTQRLNKTLPCSGEG